MTRRRPADDPEDIYDVVHGRYPDTQLTPTGRQTVYRQLAGKARPEEIAALLGVTERTVYRWQAAHRDTT